MIEAERLAIVGRILEDGRKLLEARDSIGFLRVFAQLAREFASQQEESDRADLALYGGLSKRELALYGGKKKKKKKAGRK